MKITVQKRYTLTGHNDCIYNLKHGENEHIVYSAAGDGMVVRWDLNDPEKGKLVAKMNASVYAIRFVPEFQTLIIGQNYQGIHLINIGDPQSRRSLKLTETQIFDIQYFDHQILVGTGDGLILVVDYDNLTVVKKLKVSDKSVRSIAINTELGDMAVGLSDNSIRIFALKDFMPKYRIDAHKLSVFTVEYSKDNRYLVSGSRDAHLKFWDTNVHYSLKDSIVAHMYAINSISFSDDGRFFATGSLDKTMKIWDAKARKLLKVIDRARYGGHVSSVNKILWLKRSFDLLSASDDKTIKLWDLQFN